MEKGELGTEKCKRNKIWRKKKSYTYYLIAKGNYKRGNAM